ncbi:general amino acid permease AGP2 [Sistotremastrum suecicum HHB10207 ss-3]|uniref:General amino acid permease AGP2 n=1 Tax=Sistotremastrum suecicum HHB10207 ss-3 TaxID=1314776 RepID=A0A166HTX7_9AGAM|nr:general amino acid permease AGP2 [Sistotremastrum suecicum HHB10207 ss-3]
MATPVELGQKFEHEEGRTNSSLSLKQTDHTHRRLKNRHIQLIGIGGVVGTALFVQIGAALAKGGPASLFVAFTLWCFVILAITECTAEMVTWIPISSPFLRFADHFVDEAFGFAAGINFFFFQAVQVPFEVTAVNLLIQFWTEKIPVWAIILIVLTLYLIINVFAVSSYGETEYWLALGKAILAVGLIAFTFVTMLGGNPKHDRYGFRNWDPSSVSGAPFAEYTKDGSLGRFLGFLACLISASYTIAGPEYVSMTAGEAMSPRKTMPRAFSSVFWRLTFFFSIGALCVGIVVPYNDPNLIGAINSPAQNAGASPYVLAMERLGIPVLPHIVNALILTAVFSAGNSYVFIASRTLFGLALEGKAPKQLTYCTKHGVPIYCVFLVLGISCLSFLELGNASEVVLSWFINLVTASQLLNFAVICFTYLRFRDALKAQGISRDSLPYKARWQPYATWIALFLTLLMAFVDGYPVFVNWNVTTFLFSYTMIGVTPVLFLCWKLYHKTKWRSLKEIDFFSAERQVIDEYERSFAISKN